MKKRKVILAGGSGFLGRALAATLELEGWHVTVLTRTPEHHRGVGTALKWDGQSLGPWVSALEGATAIVNLTGKNVNQRPTAYHRAEVLQSRVNSVHVLGQALRQVDQPPNVWVQASSTAIYGNAGDRICEESAHVPEGYPMDVCVAWEEALGKALLPGMRHVTMRISFVLGTDGGALPFLARLTRWGLGGRIADGKQWISWIHIEDMLRLFKIALEKDDLEGVINATTPNAETNAHFMAQLRNTLHRPWSPPVPRFAVTLGAWMLGSDPGIGLTGRRCRSRRLEELGFQFDYPHLTEALAKLYPPKNP